MELPLLPAMLTDASSPALTTVVCLWLAAIGGAVGSFLNVVVYRLPAGMSLSRPGSHCPICKHPIRWRDNVPVFGWLLLGGRCRDCHAPISARYPIVEAVFATLFPLVAWFEGLGGGDGCLPLRTVQMPDGPVPLTLSPEQLAGMVAFHLLLLCTLLTAAIIRYDRKQVPWTLAVPALVVGTIASWAADWLHPAAALEGPWAGLFDAFAGVVAGLILSGVGGLATGPDDRRAILLAAVVVGLFLGYQATLVLGVAALVVQLASRGCGRFAPTVDRITPFWWPVSTLIWLLVWRRLV